MCLVCGVAGDRAGAWVLRLTRKGQRLTRRYAAEQLRAALYLAEKVGAVKVWTHVKRRHDEVLEVTIRRR